MILLRSEVASAQEPNTRPARRALSVPPGEVPAAFFPAGNAHRPVPSPDSLGTPWLAVRTLRRALCHLPWLFQSGSPVGHIRRAFKSRQRCLPAVYFLHCYWEATLIATELWGFEPSGKSKTSVWFLRRWKGISLLDSHPSTKQISLAAAQGMHTFPLCGFTKTGDTTREAFTLELFIRVNCFSPIPA